MHSFHNTYQSVPRPGKLKTYEEIGDLMLEYGRSDKPFRFMSLPGISWEFENALKQAYDIYRNQQINFVGFERDYQVLLRSLDNMPRTNTDSVPEFAISPSLDGVYWATDSARCVCADINNILIRSVDVDQITTWDAAWLDYFGPLCATMGRSLKRLHRRFSPELSSIPVAVTIMRQREQIRWNQGMRGIFTDQGIDRKGWLEFHLGGGDNYPDVWFETLDFIEYNDTTPMCSILGLIHRR